MTHTLLHIPFTVWSPCTTIPVGFEHPAGCWAGVGLRQPRWEGAAAPTLPHSRLRSSGGTPIASGGTNARSYGGHAARGGAAALPAAGEARLARRGR
ncbi:hypothetical protein GCM10009601_10430 [Streptomyces thermospinosisporus]|uniref:Uncharacterized protein n=1 Tax=Streptomyces thermospinosisporus TaxID=161482 RepID=A0ABP4JA04_9ACTN